MPLAGLPFSRTRAPGLHRRTPHPSTFRLHTSAASATKPGNSAMATYGCCALCTNRYRYHLVEGVVSNCTDRASDYCGVGTRGELEDAAWMYCAP